MSNISKQKIIVICDFSERMKDVIIHGARMADILKKELCLTAVWKDLRQKSIIQENLIQTTRSLKSNLPNMPVSWLLLQKSLYINMQKLVDEYNAVLLVLHQSDINWVIKAFQQSSIAFLFVNGEIPRFLTYKNVLVPVDYRRASKETSLWASYLGRFNRSQIQLIYAQETNKEDAGRLHKNLEFFKKFLGSLNVRHQLTAGKSSSWGICNETLDRADEWMGDLMIFSGSSSISLIDLMIGLPEKRIVRKAGNLPILLINPRKDICMMCD
ncbi:MAG: hypothetical protein Q8S54_13565 [Bacteroidota bacterium]|nr:hypothetical protein [Odoribacter sp.]MDP3644204.1 hypothetical protein [Bacteroidota bacterium]